MPVALDGVLTKRDVDARRVNRLISVAALAGLAVALVAFLARPPSWYVSRWPEAQVQAVRAATRDPGVRLYPTDRTADWLLWRIPDLRGRVAYDVRFELFDQPALDRIVQVNAHRGDWPALLDGYDIVLVSGTRMNRAVRTLLAKPGSARFYEDKDISIVSPAR
jgi:hypothetical protein